MDRKAASAANLTGMTGSRTLAKIGGARVERLELMKSVSERLTVRMTTRANRLVSTEPPGAIAVARASMIGLDPELEVFLGMSRYFPAAKTQLSDMKVCTSD